MRSQRRLSTAAACLFAALAVLVLACACGGEDEGNSLVLRNAAGQTARLDVEIADDAEERQRGLSNRLNLAADAGMLFVIDGAGSGFWMKDTSIALSVAFISDCGEILAIADMEPFSLEIHNSPRDYRFGLEVNRGWFARNGIRVGDRVVIPAAYERPGCA